MGYNKAIAVALFAGAMLFGAYAKDCKDAICQQTDRPKPQSESDTGEAAAFAEQIKEWILSNDYDTGGGVTVETQCGGAEACLRGTLGRFGAIYDAYRMVFLLNPTNSGMAICYGVLPICVPESRRTAVAEFMTRAENKLSLSPATLVFDELRGRVYAQAALPMTALRLALESSTEKLVRGVALRLIACCEGLVDVSINGSTPKEALARVGDVYFSIGDWARPPVTNDPDHRDVVTKGISRIGNSATYEFDTRDGIVYSRCSFAEKVPESRRMEVGRFLMYLNSNMRYGLFSMDWDSGVVSCRYATSMFLFKEPLSEVGISECLSNAVYFVETKVKRYNATFASAISGGALMRDEKFKESVLLCSGRDRGAIEGLVTQIPLAAKVSGEELESELGLGKADGKEMSPAHVSQDDNSVSIPLGDVDGKISSIIETTATGGRPLAPSVEPLDRRYDIARQAFINKRLGFSERKWPTIPELADMERGSGMDLGVAERFVEAVRGNVAEFPEGELRWTEDGTNGLSIAVSDAKMRESLLKCVKDMMKGKKTANETGTLWILDDDFVFGYGIGLNEERPQEIKFVFMVRGQMYDAKPGTMVLLDFAPNQAISDSIIGAFRGDKTARANLLLLKEAKLITVVTE